VRTVTEEGSWIHSGSLPRSPARFLDLAPTTCRRGRQVVGGGSSGQPCASLLAMPTGDRCRSPTACCSSKAAMARSPGQNLLAGSSPARTSFLKSSMPTTHLPLHLGIFTLMGARRLEPDSLPAQHSTAQHSKADEHEPQLPSGHAQRCHP
jgi:hypothetical protein